VSETRLPRFHWAATAPRSKGLAAMEDAAAREAARGRQGHELRKAPSLVADRAKEIDLRASDHAAPGDRRPAHQMRLTAARHSPVENFRWLAAEGHQLLRVQLKCQ
jgi:hypothetical protein